MQKPTKAVSPDHLVCSRENIRTNCPGASDSLINRIYRDSDTLHAAIRQFVRKIESCCAGLEAKAQQLEQSYRCDELRTCHIARIERDLEDESLTQEQRSELETTLGFLANYDGYLGMPSLEEIIADHRSQTDAQPYWDAVDAEESIGRSRAEALAIVEKRDPELRKAAIAESVTIHHFRD